MALVWENMNCHCGDILDPCDNPPNGYVINTIDVAKHTTKILPNPMPCNIDSYLAYPENMDNLCECPIWDYEECGSPTGEVLLDDNVATKHTCIAECTKAGRGTARVSDSQCF